MPDEQLQQQPERVTVLTVENILKTKGVDVIVAAPDTTVQEAVRKMADSNVGSIIIREGKRTAGIFTERDLLQRVVAAGKDAASVKLSEVMSVPVKTCRLSDDVGKCAQELLDSQIRHLAVMDGETLAGIISLRDLLIASLRESQVKLNLLQQKANRLGF